MVTLRPSMFDRPMRELELIYNEASLNDNTLDGHYAGLLACMEHGRKLEREVLTSEVLDKILKEISKSNNL